MIENPILQSLILILFGFCLGILFSLWYMVRFLKLPLLKFTAALGAKLKTTEISFKQLMKGISTVIDKSLEEVERDSEQTEKKS